MFLTEHLQLPLPFEVTAARLVNLVERGAINRVSQQAYDDQIEALVRVGPLGAVPGASKLVQVRFVPPVYQGGTMTVGLRWEATGPTGGLFPVLDANVVVTEAGEQAARIELTGSYRPPLAGMGAGLDKVILRKVAQASARALLRDIAGHLTEPDEARSHPGSATGLAPAAITDPVAS
jgi:hypothetical protein